MYSLMIVDDEEIILNGIRDAISSSSLPLKSIQFASSAKEALNLMTEDPCDIIISDIRMPDIDGLEMVERAKRIWPETRVIFLTGYQDFEYARKALRLHSDDYLLKPVSDEKLIESVSNIIAKLDILWVERFELGYRTTKNVMQERIDPKIITCLLLITLGTDSGRLGGEELYNRVCGMLARLFKPYSRAMDFIQEENHILVMLQPAVEEKYWSKVSWKILEELQSFFLEHLDIKMSIGVVPKVKLEETEQIKRKWYEDYKNGGNFGSLFQLGEEEEKPIEGNYAIKAIQSYIHKNPGADLSLGALSNKFKINPSYLSRVFHQETGKPISEFIVQIRLVLAKKLLIETDMKIYEIAQKSGFETPGYFTKVFNKAEKISPKNFRIQVSKDRIEK